MKKVLIFVSLSIAAVMLLSACGAAATPVATEPPAPTDIPPICTLLADAPTTLPAAGELGAEDNPIVMAFVPSGESGVIATASNAIADCINEMTGLFYKVETGTSYAAAIEAMGSGKAHVGFLNTFSILLAQSKYGIIPALINIRAYQTNDVDPEKALEGTSQAFYKAQFITTDPTIKTLADLKGKTFCFGDAVSTSSYIVPRILLKAAGVDPDTDFAGVTLAGSHQNIAAAVYKGDCDAGVTYINVLTDENLNTTYPDLQEKVLIFAVSERIPNDGVQYVKDLDPAIQAITTKALLAMAADPGGKAQLTKLYTIKSFEEIGPDFTMYADFLAVLQAAGVDPETMVK